MHEAHANLAPVDHILIKTLRQLTAIMTLESFLSHMGIGSNQISDRYSEYAPSTQDQHVYYAYEPSPPRGHASQHVTSFKHNYGPNFKTNASMSALTLLAFLFFLHILQQCIKEHVTDMNTSPLMVMTAGRETEDNLSQSDGNKLEKIGLTQSNVMDKIDANNRKSTAEKYNARNPYSDNEYTKKSVSSIKTAVPLIDTQKEKYKQIYKNDANRDRY